MALRPKIARRRRERQGVIGTRRFRASVPDAAREFPGRLTKGGAAHAICDMTRTTTSPTIDILDGLRPVWWYGAIVFFVVGDIVTTFVGLQLSTVVEASPVAAWLIDGYGLGLIFPVKLGVVGGLYGLSRVVPHPHSIGVPLGLCALGFVLTVWNGAVIVTAVS